MDQYDQAEDPVEDEDLEADEDRLNAEHFGQGLDPDTTPEAALEAGLSDEDPEGREERSPPPPTHEVTEDGED